MIKTIDIKTIKLIHLLSIYNYSNEESMKLKIIKLLNLNENEEYNFENILNNEINKYSQLCIFKFYDTKLLKYIYCNQEKYVIYFNNYGEMIYKGQFNIITNEFEGYGVYYSSKKEEIYEGFFLKNKKNGLGTLTINNIIKLHGKWKDGKLIQIIREKHLKI